MSLPDFRLSVISGTFSFVATFMSAAVGGVRPSVGSSAADRGVRSGQGVMIRHIHVLLFSVKCGVPFCFVGGGKVVTPRGPNTPEPALSLATRSLCGQKPSRLTDVDSADFSIPRPVQPPHSSIYPCPMQASQAIESRQAGRV